jgi:tRNA threonylcarbamoyladenosine biosynthesis protein TsaE
VIWWTLFPRRCSTSPESAIRSTLTRSEHETEDLAAGVGAACRGGEVVLLTGELGAGKTAFVRGLARGLGVDPAEVASPTFVLLTSYPGRLTLHHADLYRLAGNGDDRELGLDELPGPRGVLAVEWAERLSFTPWDKTVRVALEHAGGDTRRVRIEGVTPEAR